MLETEETNDSLVHQLRRVIKDGIDYLGSVVTVLQARAADLALSSVVFVALIAAGALLAVAGFLLLVVALGFWLTHVTGRVEYALVILGGVLALGAVASVWRAVAWLKQLKS